MENNVLAYKSELKLPANHFQQKGLENYIKIFVLQRKPSENVSDSTT